MPRWVTPDFPVPPFLTAQLLALARGGASRDASIIPTNVMRSSGKRLFQKTVMGISPARSVICRRSSPAGCYSTVERDSWSWNWPTVSETIINSINTLEALEGIVIAGME